jgi:alkyl sulfatase BDS1-like metallo-beta-lactamase superfamily hydrolase
MVRALSTELFLEFLAIRMDSRKAEGMAFKINLVTPDNGEKFVIEMSNATLTTIRGYQDPRADLTITTARSDLEEVMIGATTFEKQIIDGKTRLSGDPKVLNQLASTLTQFEMGFEIMPGTPGSIPLPKRDAFAVGSLNPRGE